MSIGICFNCRNSFCDKIKSNKKRCNKFDNIFVDEDKKFISDIISKYYHLGFEEGYKKAITELNSVEYGDEEINLDLVEKVM